MIDKRDDNDSAGSDDPAAKLENEARQAGDTVKAEVKAVADHASETAHANAEAGFEKGKRVAEDQLDTLSSAVDDAADRLEADDHPLASYAVELSTQLGKLSEVIENSTLDEVAGRAHRLARQNPALFMLGSVALGFAASRFIKASDERQSSSNAGSIGNGRLSGSENRFGAADGPYRRNEISTGETRSAFTSPTDDDAAATVPNYTGGHS